MFDRVQVPFSFESTKHCKSPWSTLFFGTLPHFIQSLSVNFSQHQVALLLLSTSGLGQLRFRSAVVLTSRWEEDDDNRNHAHPDKMTLRLHSPVSFVDPTYVNSSLSVLDSNRVAILIPSLNILMKRERTLPELGAQPKRSRVLPRPTSVLTSSQRRTLTSLRMTGIGLFSSGGMKFLADSPSRCHLGSSTLGEGVFPYVCYGCRWFLCGADTSWLHLCTISMPR